MYVDCSGGLLSLRFAMVSPLVSIIYLWDCPGLSRGMEAGPKSGCKQTNVASLQKALLTFCHIINLSTSCPLVAIERHYYHSYYPQPSFVL